MVAIAQQKIDPTLKYIIPFVVIVHLVGMLFVSTKLNQIPVHKPKEHLIVRTIQLGERPRQVQRPIETVIEQPMSVAEEQPTPISTPAPIEIPMPEPIKKVEKPKPAPQKVEKTIEVKKEKVMPKKEKAKPKKVEKKAEVKKETAKKTEKKPVVKKDNTAKKKTTTPAKKETVQPKKAETAKKTVPQVDAKAEEAKRAAAVKAQALLKNAKESIAKIDKSAHNFTASDSTLTLNKTIPGKIEKLQIEALPAAGGSKVTFTPREAGYRDELISRLKLLLRLPEYGEVKVQLTLERSGKVAKVSIVSAESAANKKYIEKMLPTVNFPGFGDNFPNQDKYTFVITLSNE